MDNGTLFKGKGKGDVKGIAHVIAIGGIGKRIIGRQRTGIVFPGLPPEHCTTAVPAAVSVRSALPPVNSEQALGRGACEREAAVAKWLLVKSTKGPQSPSAFATQLQGFAAWHRNA